MSNLAFNPAKYGYINPVEFDGIGERAESRLDGQIIPQVVGQLLWRAD